MQPTPEAGQSSARNQSPHPDQRPDLTERLKMPLTGALQLAVALENIPQLTALGLGGVVRGCGMGVWLWTYVPWLRVKVSYTHTLCLRDVAWLYDTDRHIFTIYTVPSRCGLAVERWIPNTADRAII